MTIVQMLLLVAGFMPALVHGASCDQFEGNMQTAADLLNKAQEAKTFDDAKRGMSKAKYAINEVADAARTCPCAEAADLFDSAASKISRGSIADVSGRFNHYVRQGIAGFQEAIEALNACPASPANQPVPASVENSESSQSESPQNREQPAAAE